MTTNARSYFLLHLFKFVSNSHVLGVLWFVVVGVIVILLLQYWEAVMTENPLMLLQYWGQ